VTLEVARRSVLLASSALAAGVPSREERSFRERETPFSVRLRTSL
jgi:hypothetical protein